MKHFILISFFVLLGCGKRNHPIIAVASNAYTPMKQLIEAFSEGHPNNIQLVSGASGVLTSQIIQGAPYQGLVSADMIYPKVLDSLGFSISGPNRYATGHLIIWSSRRTDCDSILSLMSAAEIIVGIPNPDVAPYGRIAEQWLALSRISIPSTQKIFSENVSQLNQYIAQQAIDIALTSNSAMHEGQLKEVGFWLECTDMESMTVDQGLIVLDAKNNVSTSVRQFFEYIASEQGQTILAQFGYQ